MVIDDVLHRDPLPDHPAGSLRILRVIPPAPTLAPGTYEVRLELSRRLTLHEDEALHRTVHGMHVVGRELTIHDTTLEKVAAQAPRLAALVRQVEEEGRRLSDETERRSRAYRAGLHDRATRLADLAGNIRFPD
jgi:hypothetical protein